MGEIPHQKALVERYAGRPFAIVGVNTDTDKDEYRRQVDVYGVTWRSAWQGSTHDGIPVQWGVDAYPTIFVLDADHVLRVIDARGEQLERVVGELMAELAEKSK